MSRDLLTTSEVAIILQISGARVRQLILSGQLPSQKKGRDHFIKRMDLNLVENRRVGRPRKSGKGENIN